VQWIGRGEGFKPVRGGFMKILALCICQLLVAATAAAADKAPSAEQSLREALFTRTDRDGETYGREQLDILFWRNTRYLLTEPSHSIALRALDDFIAGHGEKSMREPWRRALLQRDLWQLFDWTYTGHEDVPVDAQWGDLQARLATVIRRLALDEQQIAALPHNLNMPAGAASIPRGLLDGRSEWVIAASADGHSAIRIHRNSFGGRSVFLVMIRMPKGRAQAEEWLDGLQNLSQGGEVSAERASRFKEPFPPGTTWALVRLILTIDLHGVIRPTQFAESVQLRRYDSAAPVDRRSIAFKSQEFDLDRSHAPRLRGVGEEEYDFQNVHFFSPGVDVIEQSGASPWRSPAGLQKAALATCSACHFGPGLYSVNSFQGLTRFDAPANVASTLELEAIRAVAWKSVQPDWLALSQLWSESR
jgi:hypothetical protein